MKHILTAFVFIGILTSCNSNQESKNPTTTIDSTAIAKDKVQMEDKSPLLPINTDEALVATALMAAPKASRAGCTVIGYNMAGEFVTFKEGNNEFIVLVDNPNQKGFNAACYHKDLDPFMARGRALKAEGKSGEEIFAIREAEVKSGELVIPSGTTLHIYYGKNTTYNPQTSVVDQAKLRYVVYMPYATAESTGLPAAPLASNHPWIMNPGTHRAHIMISPLPTPIE